MDYKNKIEIPFGAFDSEIEYQEFIIPDGFEAIIQDGKVIFRRKETEDDRIKNWLIGYFNQYIIDNMPQVFGNGLNVKDVMAWIEKQGKKEYVLKSSKNEDVIKFMQIIEKLAKSYDIDLPNRSYDIYGFAKDILDWFEKQVKKSEISLHENKICKENDDSLTCEDERIRKGIIHLVNMSYENGYFAFKKLEQEEMLTWLEKRGEHHIACSKEQMKVLDEILNFAANHESPYWNDYIFGTLNNLIRQLKKLKA